MAAWRRSGQSAREYAPRAGVSAASLHRWASLWREYGLESATALVEVVPSEPSAARWGWEVELAAGTMRGTGALEPTTAKAIVEALVRAGRR